VLTININMYAGPSHITSVGLEASQFCSLAEGGWETVGQGRKEANSNNNNNNNNNNRYTQECTLSFLVQ